MDTKGGRFIYEPLTPALITRHFSGEVTIGLTAIDTSLCSKWLSFDSDTSDGSLDILEQFLKKYGWHAIREGRRNGRDGHLWLLFDVPVLASQLIVLGDAMMSLAGVTGLERFPKSATGLSQVRGPLGINQKPEAVGAIGWFDNVQHDINSQLQWLAMQPLNSAADAIRQAERHKPEPIAPMPTRPRFGKSLGSFPKFSILEHVYARQGGSELVARCPLCAREGHDQHEDNLKIKSDGSTFCCVYGGPNMVHTTRDIVRHYTAR
jgi:hypothetical protein